MWFGTGYGSTPRDGTVDGSYWIEFDLGQVYSLSEMQIWNYNVLGLANRGVKGITVECSTVGGTNSASYSAPKSCLLMSCFVSIIRVNTSLQNTE